MSQVVAIPSVKISGQGITLYTAFDGLVRKDRVKVPGPRMTGNQEADIAALEAWNNLDTTKPKEKPPPAALHGEELSPRSVSHLKNAIYCLLWLSGCKTISAPYIITSAYKKISFITLTLPSMQRHPDTYIKSIMLNHFFTELRGEFQDVNYVWRSEKQKNGNVHFHVLTDIYFAEKTLRGTWNRILNKQGYVDNYTAKFSSMTYQNYYDYMKQNYGSRKDAIDRGYEKGCKSQWKDPNSTDIHSLRKVENISGYICKEMTKKNNNCNSMDLDAVWAFPLSGKNWSCSQLISSKSALSEAIPNSIYSELQSLEKMFPDHMYKNEHITHFSISPDRFLHLGLKRTFDFYHSFITSKHGKDN